MGSLINREACPVATSLNKRTKSANWRSQSSSLNSSAMLTFTQKWSVCTQRTNGRPKVNSSSLTLATLSQTACLTNLLIRESKRSGCWRSAQAWAPSQIACLISWRTTTWSCIGHVSIPSLRSVRSWRPSVNNKCAKTTSISTIEVRSRFLTATYLTYRQRSKTFASW